MNVSIKQTLTISKKGKRVIIEENEYEFCEDLWRYIKEFVFYDQKWFDGYIMPYRVSRLYEAFNSTLHFHHEDKKYQKLADAVWKIHQEEYLSSFSRDIGSTALKPFGLPRFKKETLEIIKKGRKAGFKLANFNYRLVKKLVEKGEMDEEEAFDRARYNTRNRIQFYKQIEEIEAKQNKK